MLPPSPPDVCCPSPYPNQVAKGKVEATYEAAPLLKASLAALYDTLVIGYLRGYTEDADKYQVAAYDAELHKAGYAICKMAVVVMADFIA